MNIQIINYNPNSLSYDREKYILSSLDSPKSLDEFDTTIIDLSSEELWRYGGINLDSINMIKDIINLNTILKHSKKSKILIVIPQDLSVKYNYGYHSSSTKSGKHHKYTVMLKNVLKWAEANIINVLIPDNMKKIVYMLLFEETTTNINGLSYNASFHFITNTNDSVLTKSKSSEKNTSLKMDDRLILTTNNVLQSEEHLLGFLSKCNWITNTFTYPEWLIDYPILDDTELSTLISEQEHYIDQAQLIISTSNDKIKDNLEIKSILFVNGDTLVTVVFKLLETLLDIDLTEFEDVKKEDFIIRINDDLEFIGEIKGVTSNIKSEHVSQLDVHYQKHLDYLTSENKSIRVKALLIMNPLRNTPVENREPVNDEQIRLATRNGALIIETVNLLYLYEKFVSGEVNSSACRILFQTKVGVLTKNDIEQFCTT